MIQLPSVPFIYVEYGYKGDGADWTTLDAPTIGHIERKLTEDGKLAGWVTPDGGNISFTYDAAGRLWKETDPNGRTTEYTRVLAEVGMW